MSSPIDLDVELAAALAAVRAAARAADGIAAGEAASGAVSKEDRSPVTEADFTAQALACAILGERSRVAAVVGEERAGDLPDRLAAAVAARLAPFRPSPPGPAEVRAWLARGEAEPDPDGWFWTLDPVDGTKGFLRGGQWAVALALVGGGAVQLGVLGCPRWSGGRVLWAVRGGGARLGSLDDGDAGAPLQLGDAPAALRLCESVEAAHSDQAVAARVAARLGITAAPLRLDSQVKYAAVASGEAAVYLRLPTRADYREKIWDHAAGALVVTEAGGAVSDVDGAPLDFTRGRRLEANRGVVAAHRALHAEALAALREGA